MQIRPIIMNRDFTSLKKWWTEHEWPIMAESAFPKIGFIVEDLAAGFLYKTDSQFALMEWIISNPNADKNDRDKALDLLITTIQQRAKLEGFKYIYSTIKHPKLMQRYERLNMIKTDNNMTIFIGVL